MATMLRKLLLAHSEVSQSANISHWPFVCEQVSTCYVSFYVEYVLREYNIQIFALSAEVGCGESAGEILKEVTEQYIHPINGGSRDIDTAFDILLSRVLRPIAALLSHTQSTC